MAYEAPVRDIRFTLEEIVAMDGLKATGKFDEVSRDLVTQVLAEAAKYAENVLDPLNEPGDRAGARLARGVVSTAPGFKDAYAQFVAGGWQGMSAPAEAGGMGLPRALALSVSEMIQSANMAFGLCPMLTLGGIEALLAHGTDEQKQLYLPKLVSGEWTCSMNLTEPHAGSDVGLLRTRAVAHDDGSYRISGQKIWITWGEHDCAENILHLVLARLPDAPAGTKGISLFLVPKFLVNADGSLGNRNDLQCIGLEHKMGIHASPTCVMSYGDQGGAIGYLVGSENGGMRAMFTMMNSARINVGVQGVGIAERAYQRALAFATDRRQGRTPSGAAPGPIVEHPDVRRMLMTMRAKIQAARGICYAAGVAADFAEHDEAAEDRAFEKRREDLLTPLAKAWSTDVAVEVTSLAVQVHGGMGFVEEAGAAQYYRDARITPIYEGTNGIQAIDLVGRKVVADDGRAMAELIEDIRETAEDLALSSNPDLPPIGQRLARGADALERATAWLLEPGRAEVDRLAGATAYLALAGEVVGGWMLGVGAVAGQRRLKDEEGDPAYAEERIRLARFYAETVLSRAPAALDGIHVGAEVLFGEAAAPVLSPAE